MVLDCITTFSNYIQLCRQLYPCPRCLLCSLQPAPALPLSQTREAQSGTSCEHFLPGKTSLGCPDVEQWRCACRCVGCGRRCARTALGGSVRSASWTASSTPTAASCATRGSSAPALSARGAWVSALPAGTKSANGMQPRSTEVALLKTTPCTQYLCLLNNFPSTG